MELLTNSSKIYHQQFTDLTFDNIEQAKDFWFTEEGMELFDYCCDTEFPVNKQQQVTALDCEFRGTGSTNTREQMGGLVQRQKKKS